ncbi:FAD-dependent oxidoreductase [Bacillus sp. FJAT-45350]|uniref:FAD-dependent oxidoreductase n=1 Tax=Bacillus sp. FJAT-45350 TaxID=2011014 RepID=UPI000BB8F603|nr:FAD-dependent oxidoreductase [Bacillus sp. FJAT-45350]
MSNHEVIVYSSTGCPHCEKVKEALKAWGIEYDERNVSVTKEYFDELMAKNVRATPATFINGKLILGFHEKRFRKALGLNEEAKTEKVDESNEKDVDIFKSVDKDVLNEVYDFVMIGGGPAGASAAVYGARAKLKTLVIDKAPKAGTLAITHKIANYPGVRGELTGLELLDLMQRQAHDFGAEFVRSNVLSVDFAGDIKKIEVPEGVIQAKSVFIGVGAKAPSSKITGEEEFTGRGVSYCSTCDAAFYQNKVVAVVGENEEAIHEAETLSKFCNEVRVIIPTGNVKGDADLSTLESLDNVQIFKKHRVKEILGENGVEKLVIQDDKREQQTWEVDGIFLYLAGMKPGTDFLGNAVERDEEGYVVVDENLRTNVDGVFAGGDARRTPIKQAVISAADGAIAALGADQHVNSRTKLRPQYS